MTPQTLYGKKIGEKAGGCIYEMVDEKTNTAYGTWAVFKTKEGDITAHCLQAQPCNCPREDIV